jgi:hypothetical protein
MDPKKYLACLFLAVAAFGSNVGDTYQQVIAEKGQPKSQIEAGNLQILNFADTTVRLRDGVVVSISTVKNSARADAVPTPTQTPAARLADVEKELREAVTKAQNIINQPATISRRNPEMRVWEYDYWFRPGVEKPDFNTVDVRNTQQNPYDNEDFVCLKTQPDIVWVGHDLEFNPMTKFFYVDRSIPKKKLTPEEMITVNKLYRIIGRCEKELGKSGIQLKPSS